MKKIKIAMIGNLLLINFSFAGDVKILDNPSMPKIIAITSGTVTLILTGCLGVKMHKKRQAIDSNEKRDKKMKDDKKTDDVEIDRLKQWYNYFVAQNTNLFNRNAKLQNVISEVSKKYKKYTANACKVVNERWANKYPQHARSG